MAKFSSIDFDHLISLTASFLRNENLLASDLKGNYRNRDGIWGQISQKVFRSDFNVADSLYLWKLWERNTKDYKSNVLGILQTSGLKKITN